MIPEIGDCAEVDKKIRVVREIIEGEKGQSIIIWTCSNGDIGGCVPSLWKEWVDGFDPRKRRGQPKTHEYYRF